MNLLLGFISQRMPNSAVLLRNLRRGPEVEAMLTLRAGLTMSSCVACRVCYSELLSLENISTIKELKTNSKKENLNKSNYWALENKFAMCCPGKGAASSACIYCRGDV